MGTARILKGTPIANDVRVIFELQAVDPAQAAGFTGVGWTWLDIADKQTGRLRTGPWTLPIYGGRTQPAVAAGIGKRPPLAPGLALTVRVGPPGDPVFDATVSETLNLQASPVPREHSHGAKQLFEAAPLNA